MKNNDQYQIIYKATSSVDLINSKITRSYLNNLVLPDSIKYVNEIRLSFKNRKTENNENESIIDMIVESLSAEYQTLRLENQKLHVSNDIFTIILNQYDNGDMSILAGTCNSKKKNMHELLELKLLKLIDLEEAPKENKFRLYWYYSSGSGITFSQVDGYTNSQLLDSAYPWFKDGVDSFIDDYLNSDESVLILRGPPGTGKTHLIRKILSGMSNRKGSISTSIYTGDSNVFNHEKVFISFMVENIDSFVIEDADFLLESRMDGNHIMHNFLKGADGLISSQGKKKIIFSVNLNNTIRIDDALIRPGRCFGIYDINRLDNSKAQQVLRDIGKQYNVDLSNISLTEKTYSLAELYKLAKSAK